jgi:hypothetical protein
MDFREHKNRLCRGVRVTQRGSHDGWQVRTFYIELLKRLDDSNDTIRCEAAAAFKEFLASVPIGMHTRVPPS